MNINNFGPPRQGSISQKLVSNLKERPILYVIPLFVLVTILYVAFRQLPIEEAQLSGASDPTKAYEFQRHKQKYDAFSSQYEIAIIADMDTASHVAGSKGGHWKSKLKKGILSRELVDVNDVQSLQGSETLSSSSPSFIPSVTSSMTESTRSSYKYKYHVKWTEDVQLKSSFNAAGRALELSELVHFDGKLIAVDDRTGICYEVSSDDPVPLHILMDGDGNSPKAFKAEWATVKDGQLYVGGIGKEWTDENGQFVNNDPLWVKVISRSGSVSHINWFDVYTKIRKFTGADFPGYVIHEAVVWNPLNRRWYFLPRPLSF